jgi:hypothetical protein
MLAVCRKGSGKNRHLSRLRSGVSGLLRFGLVARKTVWWDEPRVILLVDPLRSDVCGENQEAANPEAVIFDLALAPG